MLMTKRVETIKILQSSFFRAVCALAVGGLLLFYPTSTLKGITIGIGVLFLIPGVLSCVTYWRATQARREEGQAEERDYSMLTLPIVAIGSILLGLFMTLTPSWFVGSLMYVLSAMVILGAINQMMALYQVRKYVVFGVGYWLTPIILMAVGIFMLFNPIKAASVPLIILGLCLIVYGISEMVNSMAIHRETKGMLVREKQRDRSRDEKKRSEGTKPAERKTTDNRSAGKSSDKMKNDEDDDIYVEYEEVND